MKRQNKYTKLFLSSKNVTFISIVGIVLGIVLNSIEIIIVCLCLLFSTFLYYKFCLSKYDESFLDKEAMEHIENNKEFIKKMSKK